MKLATKTVEKPWGRRDLPAPFAAPGDTTIGEIWFDPPPALPQVLIKYLFTSEKLSIQVHPTDAQAPPGSRGKEECWLVLAAEPGAMLGIGFREAIDAQAMRAAALDGSIEQLMVWHEVAAGDFFYLPAGTVHAIGPGLTLVEVQQNSDITYRLYDYGRPRELHLEEGIAVARGEPYPAACRSAVAAEESRLLVAGPHFRFAQVAGAPEAELAAAHPGAVLALPLDGRVTIAGEIIAPGECGYADRLDMVDFAAARRTLLVSNAV
ncbi:class I mannose-6-phosphate isomerase [Qipengyuania sediminis]|uniref:class I mannose-6-phosphate isomerase n=1 Tax=Qipengyuania sediminis TaxID=1532023 RepID=UPI001059DD1F|nr:class I mannose-6-phosphate isomerase [Qipengyuania sediminis]